MNKDTVKAKAKALQTFMAGKGVSLKYSAALEAIARIEGLPSYNVMQSQRKAQTLATPVQPEATLATWDIEVCRVGYANTVVIVKGARSYQEAAARALEELDTDCFSSENSSDYVIVGKEEPKEPLTAPVEEQLGEACDWEVGICRMAYGTNTLRIPAQGLTKEQAEELALDEAGHHYYSTHHAEYEVTGAYPLQSN